MCAGKARQPGTALPDPMVQIPSTIAARAHQNPGLQFIHSARIKALNGDKADFMALYRKRKLINRINVHNAAGEYSDRTGTAKASEGRREARTREVCLRRLRA